MKTIIELSYHNKDHFFVKEETMPDEIVKIILKEKKTGKIIQRPK